VYDPSFEGVNNLMVIFKVPLAILALIIPIVAIIASNHRSVQTAKQIDLVHAQNIFSNYFKHKEEFELYLAKFGDHKEALFKDACYLHRLLYPNALKGDFSVNQDVIDEIKEDVKDFKDLCRQLENVDDLFGANLGEIYELIESICSYCEIDSNTLNYYLPGGSNRLKYVDLTGEERVIFLHGQPINLPYKFLQAVRAVVYAMDFCATADIEYDSLRLLWAAEFTSKCTVEEFQPIHSTFSD
jgi:hypothetical protein